ncbi:Type I restriction enzyme, M subunit [Spiroplasma kunkelii CR2-3x]|uniref:site-specific DNA-methyltransferase (adenine-specific) n=1 Tax=Spiroplasma kunkelii CR2-3x TaxID=273035 RepID=A0A0K2JHQ0_SPIKU|nr:type I restriction-modification system subunit M [Spiroplasma kunkelii]ALA97952.1 Type I restriction enzyme, M subunit [Spiroplasma kunkelii CR2-3x]
MTTHEKQNLQQQQLFSKLWDISNTLLGTMEPSEYNVQYIIEKDLKIEGIDYQTALTNEKYRNYFLEVLYDNDSAVYYIEPEYLWQEIINKINIGKFDIFLLRKAFKNLPKTGHLSEKEFENLFDSVDLDYSKLGKTETEKSKIIAKVMLKINEINFEINESEIDILGDAYEYLISKFASESVKEAGEFYTPQPVSKLLAKLVSQKKAEIKTVYDPTCGSGSLLLRVYKELKIGYLYGQELKKNSYNIARMNMMLHGLKYNKFDIYNGDTLEDDGFKRQQFEIIVANPSYSTHWSANQKFLSDERFSAYGKLAPKTKADFAFIQNMIYKLSDNGVMAVVIPHGILFRGNAELIIRKYMVKKNWIDTIISLPANMFYGTSIPTCIIVIKKCKIDNSIFFIDASKEFKKQGNKNALTDENIIKIINIFNKRKTIDKFSNLIDIEIIKENDYNLNIDRYIDNTKEKEIINIKELQNKLINNKKEIQKLDEEFNLMLKDLVINNE